jgi:phage tail-like protein
VDGKIQRRQISVVLVDALGQEKWRWIFDNAYPVKWSGSEFNAANSAVFVENVEFAHNGIRRG